MEIKRSKFTEQRSQHAPAVWMKMQTTYMEMGSTRNKLVPSRVQPKQNLTLPETRVGTKDNSSTLDWRMEVK